MAVIKMIKNLSELEELCLLEFDSCSSLLINAMKFNNPLLKKVCFSMDMHHFLRFCEESAEFMPDIAYHYLSDEDSILLSRSLPNLSTMELHHPENLNYWGKYI